MKKIIILLAFFAIGSLTLLAQPPALPPSNASNNGTNGPVGDGAPIGTGIFLMSGLFAAYGAKKAWDMRKRLEE